MLNDKKTKSNKKYKITRQYKFLSNEFNPVSLKARLNLNQINNFLNEKEKNNKKIKKDNSNLSEDNYSDTEENNRNNKNKMFQKENKSKTKSFVCPSDSVYKKLKNYQGLEKNKIFKEKGFIKYITKMIPNSKIVHNLKKVINEKYNLHYDLYIFPKIENKKIISTDNKNVSLKCPKKEENSSKIKSKSKSIMINDSINIQKDIDKKYKTNGFLNKKAKKYNLNKNIRIMSAPKIDWREKKKDWKKNNKNINEVDYRFFLDRPISPLSNDKSVKPLPNGGGVLYSNSIWRTKKINDLVPRSNSNVLEKLNDFKKKRNEIIYKRQNSLPYDFTFLSNRLIVDDDFFIY